MAYNWKVGEAIRALKAGDLEARKDIGRRFPLFATATFEEILGAIDFVSVRKIEKALRGSDIEDEDEDEAEEKKEKKSKREKKGKEKKSKDKEKKEKKVKPKDEDIDEDDDEIEDEDDDIFDDDDEE